MTELDKFIYKIKSISGNDTVLTSEQSQMVVNELNRFLFSKQNGLGTVRALDSDWDFFSPYHKFWYENAERIISPSIDVSTCRQVAEVLLDVYQKTGGKAFESDSGVMNRDDLTDEEVCRVRLLTANQDFRGSRNYSELVKLYKKDKTWFDIDRIKYDPEGFLSYIDVIKLSQTDKRKDYAINICGFIESCNTRNPFNTIDHFDGDLEAFRNGLIKYSGAGYGEKKTDMFIRDMVVSGVWRGKKNFDKINVASDVNTITVALRTGILKTGIPLVSSFLDIFSYQYGLIDSFNAKAWRCVWEEWNKLSETDVVASPCMLDFFIYRTVGKEFCSPRLVHYKCDNGHDFYWNRKLLKCKGGKNCSANIHLIAQTLPCESDDASAVITKTDFYQYCKSYTQCPFKPVCDNGGRKNQNPPKSISILGGTGWQSAYAEEGAGGGGPMA